MFKLKLLIVALSVVCLTSNAQKKYIELNVGAALIDDGFVNGWFPGTSVLIGNQFELQNSLFLDAEIGIAFPSVVTAKVGLGVYTNKSKNASLVFGVRPFPMHGYAQVNLPQSSVGQWLFSAEIGGGNDLSLYSHAILNCGYRWKVFRAPKR